MALVVVRRRPDPAVPRALRTIRGQTRAGVGVAVGRTVRRVVADITPLQYAAPVALPAQVPRAE